MTREEAYRESGMSEEEIRRALCEHEFGPMAHWTPFGCTRTCTKCGQMQCTPNHCGQHDKRTNGDKGHR